MRILEAETRKRMTWKNGGGETIELAVHPSGADISSFGWRVSTARVATDGPFSDFAGIDRTLSILEGEGMVLDIAGVGERTLTQGSDPLRFPADAPTLARLLGGPILDLNVMTRRGAFEHRVRRLAVDDRRTIRPTVRWTIVLSLGPLAIETADGTAHPLGPRDAVILAADDGPVALFPASPQTAFLIEIDTAEPA